MGQIRAAAESIGFPVVVKPIAGAGSMDPFRAGSMAELDRELSQVQSSDEVNVEAFIGDGSTATTAMPKGSFRGRYSQSVARKYKECNSLNRAHERGRIRRIEGLQY